MGDLREEIKDRMLVEIKASVGGETVREAVSTFHDFITALRMEAETITKKQLKRNSED